MSVKVSSATSDFIIETKCEVIGEEFDRATAIAERKEEAKKIRRKKKRTASSSSFASNTFQVFLPASHYLEIPLLIDIFIELNICRITLQFLQTVY